MSMAAQYTCGSGFAEICQGRQRLMGKDDGRRGASGGEGVKQMKNPAVMATAGHGERVAVKQ